MLTTDLVRARVRSGVLHPEYVDPEKPGLLELATALIELFEAHVGKSRRALDDELRAATGDGTEFLLHRGLAKLLFDRCEFETSTPVEPAELRREVFRAAAAVYRSERSLRFERDAVVEPVRQQRGLTAEELERALYADLKEEQLVREFESCRPDWLLQRYNVALAQAVLLRATELRVELEAQSPSFYREFFRRVKFFRLLYEIESSAPGDYRIRLDGPLSLFKSSSRYGIQMAQFLPTILHCDRFRLSADVRWGPSRRSVRFELDASRGLRPVSHLVGQWLPDEVRWFRDQFAKLKSDWTIGEDSEVFDLGEQGVLTPDHVFIHEPSGARVYMEILGFWRRGSVGSRLRLLRSRGPKNLIVALSKEFCVDREDLHELPGEVYVFRKAPVARAVLKILGEFY